MPGTSRDTRSTMTASVIDEVMQSLSPNVRDAHMITSAADAPSRASAASAANCSIVRASLSAVMLDPWHHSRPKRHTVHANSEGHANLDGSLLISCLSVSDHFRPRTYRTAAPQALFRGYPWRIQPSFGSTASSGLC